MCANSPRMCLKPSPKNSNNKSGPKAAFDAASLAEIGPRAPTLLTTPKPEPTGPAHVAHACQTRNGMNVSLHWRLALSSSHVSTLDSCQLSSPGTQLHTHGGRPHALSMHR